VAARQLKQATLLPQFSRLAASVGRVTFRCTVF
jgi:hypothetical protein